MHVTNSRYFLVYPLENCLSLTQIRPLKKYGVSDFEVFKLETQFCNINVMEGVLIILQYLQICLLANISPESVDEVFAIVPTLKVLYPSLLVRKKVQYLHFTLGIIIIICSIKKLWMMSCIFLKPSILIWIIKLSRFNSLLTRWKSLVYSLGCFDLWTDASEFFRSFIPSRSLWALFCMLTKNFQAFIRPSRNTRRNEYIFWKCNFTCTNFVLFFPLKTDHSPSGRNMIYLEYLKLY